MTDCLCLIWTFTGTKSCWCLIKHLRIFLGSLRQSSEIFGNFREMFGNVRVVWSWTTFWESSASFGKWSKTSFNMFIKWTKWCMVVCGISIFSHVRPYISFAAFTVDLSSLTLEENFNFYLYVHPFIILYFHREKSNMHTRILIPTSLHQREVTPIHTLPSGPMLSQPWQQGLGVRMHQSLDRSSGRYPRGMYVLIRNWAPVTLVWSWKVFWRQNKAFKLLLLRCWKVGVLGQGGWFY